MRDNFKKSIKLLNASRAGGGINEQMYLNNMGCIYFRSQRFSMAALYFAKALREAERCDIRRSDSSEYEIMYNAGLQLLLSGNNLETAIDCFSEAAKQLHARPRVWLRLAECCIVLHAKRLQEAQRERSAQSSHGPSLRSVDQMSKFSNDLVSGIAGAGRYQRVLLPVSNGEAARQAGALGPRTGSLHYAIACLENVIFLTHREPEAASNESKEAAGSGANASAVEIRAQETRGAALACLAYCALCTQNPTMALEYAAKLLAEPSRCTPTQSIWHTPTRPRHVAP